MVIYYQTRGLERICNIAQEAVKKLGSVMAKKLHQRILELNAFECLADVPHTPPQRRHMLSGRRKGQFSVDLQHPFRLLFIPANDPIPLKDDGGYDLSQITEIEIIRIEDTH